MGAAPQKLFLNHSLIFNPATVAGWELFEQAPGSLRARAQAGNSML